MTRTPHPHHTVGRALSGVAVAGVIVVAIAWLMYASATAAGAWTATLCDEKTGETRTPGSFTGPHAEQDYYDWKAAHKAIELGDGQKCKPKEHHYPPKPTATSVPTAIPSTPSPAPAAPTATPPSAATPFPTTTASTSSVLPTMTPVALASTVVPPPNSPALSGGSSPSTSASTTQGRSSDQTPIQVCLSYAPSKESPTGLVTRTIKRDETNAYREAWAPSHLDHRGRTIEGPCLPSELHPATPTAPSPTPATSIDTSTKSEPTPEWSPGTNTTTTTTTETSPLPLSDTPTEVIGTAGLCLYIDDLGTMIEGIPTMLEDGTGACLVPSEHPGEPAILVIPPPDAPVTPAAPAPYVPYCQTNPSSDECRSTPGSGLGRG